jgi:hypothetical protein
MAPISTDCPPACGQVEVFRRQDATKGIRVAQVLEGFISRKVVKQTVMTVVYGVTRYGGRLQIEKRLRELSSFPQVRGRPCSLHPATSFPHLLPLLSYGPQASSSERWNGV